jgi:hypothetical protein
MNTCREIMGMIATEAAENNEEAKRNDIQYIGCDEGIEERTVRTLVTVDPKTGAYLTSREIAQEVFDEIERQNRDAIKRYEQQAPYRNPAR